LKFCAVFIGFFPLNFSGGVADLCRNGGKCHLQICTDLHSEKFRDEHHFSPKLKKSYFVNILASSNPNSMNYFLYCSPHLALQFKKKFIEIGLLDAKIFTKNDFLSL
jgi:hypothetical protein